MKDGGEHPLKLARCRGLLAATVLFSIFTNLLVLTGPLFVLQIYARVLPAQSVEALALLTGLAGLLLVCFGLLDWARGRLLARIGERLQDWLDDAWRSAVLRRPPEPAMPPTDSLRRVFGTQLARGLVDLPWTPLFALALFAVHPWSGWLAVAGLCGLGLAGAALRRGLNNPARSLASGGGRPGSWPRRASPGMAAPAYLGQVDEHRSPDLDTRGLGGKMAAIESFSSTWRLVLQTGMLALGAWLVLRQELGAGAMVATAMLLPRMLTPASQVSAGWPQIVQARMAMREARVLSEDAAKAGPFPMPANGQVVCSGVSVLAPDRSRALLRNLSFEVAAGASLAILGPSGSGKTVLARLLTGQVRPAAGDLSIGGARPWEVSVSDLAACMGYAPEDTEILPGSVALNVGRGAASVQADQVAEALELLSQSDVIRRLPQGAQTEIGCAISQLSRGEKRRLMLARAVYGRPPVTIVDEPGLSGRAGLASLARVLEYRASHGGTTVILTREPAVAELCDQVLALSNGVLGPVPSARPKVRVAPGTWTTSGLGEPRAINS